MAQTFNGTLTVTITLQATITGVGVTPSSVTLPAVNAGMLIGAISVTKSDGTPFTGTIALGTDATSSKFALSSTTLPSNLLVGSTSLPAGTDNIAISATM